MKVVFLTKTGFVKQHLQDMYIDAVSKAHDVELWDLSAIYNRNDKLSDRVPADQTIQTLAEFDTALSQLPKPALLLTNIMFYSLKRLYPAIQKHQLEIAAIFKEGLFSFLNEVSPYSLSLRRNGLVDVIKIMVKRFSWVRVPYNFFKNGRARYDYLFATTNFYPEYTHRFIKTHYVKYDEYLAFRGAPPVLDRPYAVFLDSAATTHPTYQYTSRRALNPERYINLLNRLFDQIERETGLDVVIAAHPKADYTEQTFHGRQIIRYQTPALIEHCSLALAHFTTAVINAILAGKPLAFLYYDEMLRCGQKFITVGGIELGKRIHAPLIDLEHPQPISLAVDPAAYQAFIDEFILDTGHPDQSTEGIILSFLDDYARNHPAEGVAKA